MYGLLVAEKASGAIVVTSGMFTQEAKIFAADKPLDLVEGNALAELIRSVRGRSAPPGKKFWGCTRYPRCKFTAEAA